MSVCSAKFRPPESAHVLSAGHRCRQPLPARCGVRSQLRRGVSLLEAIMAITLAALLMSPVVAILRTSRVLYGEMQQQHSGADAVYGTLRHVRSQLRTAQRVTSVRRQGQRLTILEIVGSDGQVCRWHHDRRSGRLLFEKAGQSTLLADRISSFDITALDAAGQPATSAGTIQTLRCTASTVAAGSHHATCTSTCSVWLRPDN